MIKRMLLCAVLLLSASAAFALPDVSWTIWYYNENGDVVGSYTLACNGQRSSTGVTTDIYEEVSMACTGYMEPIMCDSGSGMSQLSGSSCESCYSGSYVFWYNMDELPDCSGRYTCRNSGKYDPTPGNGNTQECCDPLTPGCCPNGNCGF